MANTRPDRFGEVQASEPVAAGVSESEAELHDVSVGRVTDCRIEIGLPWRRCCWQTIRINWLENSVRFRGRDSVDSGNIVKPTLELFHRTCKGYTMFRHDEFCGL